MRRIFGAKKEKAPPPSLDEAAGRINSRGESLDDRIRKLDAELIKHREQIKRTRPGPAQEAAKARAMRVLKQKKLLDNQRTALYNQSYNIEQIAFAAETAKDAQLTVSAMKAASKDLKQQMGAMKIEDLDKLNDEMMDFMDYSNEVQEALSSSYGLPDEIDDEELLGELDALEADMGSEPQAAGSLPSYLMDDNEPEEAEADLNFPSAPVARAAPPSTASALPIAEETPRAIRT